MSTGLRHAKAFTTNKTNDNETDLPLFVLERFKLKGYYFNPFDARAPRAHRDFYNAGPECSPKKIHAAAHLPKPSLDRSPKIDTFLTDIRIV
jgi:hypothetical protein